VDEDGATTLGQLALIRDGYQCFRCGVEWTAGVPFECHHRLTARFGPDTLDNRLTFCGRGNNLSDADGRVLCHGWVHHNGTEARDAGWIISIHDRRQPGQIPARHHQLGLVFLTREAQMIPEADVVAWARDDDGTWRPLTEADHY
jgi:hypothetical protein